MSRAEMPEWGPNLYAYLKQYWESVGTNANEWADQHAGVSQTVLSRWARGVNAPSIDKMIPVADALGISLIDILIGAGIIEPSEVGRDAVPPAVPTLDEMIATGPGLEPWQRVRLAEILESMREVESRAAAARKPRRR